jgi:TRAP-type C4-dicarboxylate transport system permease small subunit
MRTRTIFIILLILVLLIASGPALIAVGSQEIAEVVFGCEVDLNRVIPCVIGGKDYGQTFYDLGFLIWYSYLSLPVGGVLLAIWAVAALIAFIVGRARKREQA